MQEKTLDKLTTPSLTAIERISADLRVFGYCTEKTKQQIIDEEKTHAAEVVANVCYSADIPRFYKVSQNDLVDNYGVSLTQVLQNGIEFINNSSYLKMGREWELRRRQIERNNLKSIIDMPPGLACIEISSTDTTKSEAELKQWGYSGDTLIRISYKNADTITQRNIILKSSDMHILNMLRKHIDKNSENVNSSESALESPQYVAVNQDYFDSFIADIHNFSTEIGYSKNPLRCLASIIKKAKTPKQNSWDYVSNHSLFEELFNRFVELAKQGEVTCEVVDMSRAGVWQLLINEINQKQTKKTLNYSIDDGIVKARAVGAVFTSCGGTVSINQKANQSTNSFIDRYGVVQMLLCKIGKMGNCNSCGSTTLMYGCGVYCRSCNQIWCREYLNSGRQLNHKEVADKKFSYFFRWS